MDSFYSVGYFLGTIIGVALIVSPLIILGFVIRKLVKSKSQKSIEDNKPTRKVVSEPGVKKVSPREQRKKQKEQKKLEAQRRKAERIAKREAEKQERLKIKAQEAELLNKIEALDQTYPLKTTPHIFEITYKCKNRKEFETIDPETIILDRLRKNPAETVYYRHIVLPNIEMQEKYEEAFRKEIYPHTSNQSIRNKIKRKGILDMPCFVYIRYSYVDKISRKKKVDSRTEIVRSTNKIFYDVVNGIVRESEKKRFAKEQRAAMTPSMRYDILKRDGFRCQICGATQEDGVKLHVDHIVPVSKGGETKPENLRTLCETCNIGKGAKLEELDNRVIGATIGVIHNS